MKKFIRIVNNLNKPSVWDRNITIWIGSLKIVIS